MMFAASSDRPHAPGDNPWLWAARFAMAALLGLAIIGPKYLRRQEAVELRYQAREEIARRAASGEPSATAPAERTGLIVPLWTLAGVLAAAAAGSAAMAWCTGRRQSGT